MNFLNSYFLLDFVLLMDNGGFVVGNKASYGGG